VKILIVDDSATMRKIIRRNLRQAGYEPTDVLEAGDGVEALTVLEGNTVDVIFSDVNMPNMNGVELLDKIKASDATSASSPKPFDDVHSGVCCTRPCSTPIGEARLAWRGERLWATEAVERGFSKRFLRGVSRSGHWNALRLGVNGVMRGQ